MNKEARAYCLRRRKIAAIEWAEKWGNVSRACRTFRVSRAGFYRWKKLYEEHGEDGLKRRKPIAKDHPRRISEATVQKVLGGKVRNSILNESNNLSNYVPGRTQR